MDSINVSDFLGDKGRFEDIEQLDRCGTTSLAYKVRIHNQLLFMKKLRPEFSNDESYRLLFYKEFNTGKTIKSPYVVDYVEINDDEEGVYILMEYVSGSTLKQKIEREPEYFLQEENVWKLLLHLCEAVKALHHENVLHLDISPDNLMLSQTNGDLKLLDLGFCLSNFDDTTPGFKAGFCAPEVNLRDSKEVDARTDIYSVGIILKYIQDKTVYIYACKHAINNSKMIIALQNNRGINPKKLIMIINPAKILRTICPITIFITRRTVRLNDLDISDKASMGIMSGASHMGTLLGKNVLKYPHFLFLTPL